MIWICPKMRVKTSPFLATSLPPAELETSSSHLCYFDEELITDMLIEETLSGFSPKTCPQYLVTCAHRSYTRQSSISIISTNSQLPSNFLKQNKQNTKKTNTRHKKQTRNKQKEHAKPKLEK